MGLNAFLPELTVYAIERFQLTDPADKTFWGVLGLRPPDTPHWWGRASLFWITSALAATAGVLLWRFVAESHGAAARPQSFLRELLQSSGSLLRRPVFAWLLVLVLGLRLGQN